MGGAGSGVGGVVWPSGATPGTPSPAVTGSACAVAGNIGAASAVTATLSSEFGASTPK